MMSLKTFFTWIAAASSISVAGYQSINLTQTTESAAVIKEGAVSHDARASLNTQKVQIAPEMPETFIDSEEAFESDGSMFFAINSLLKAAEKNDPEMLDRISKLPADCPNCQRFFAETRAIFSDPSLGYDQKIYLAKALASGKNSSNQKFLLEQMNQPASQDNEVLPPSVIGNILEDSKLPPEVIDELQQSLDSDNPYIRDAAISILTKQGSLEALQKLYDFTVKQNDPSGFYNDGMGIGKVTPSEEALPFLEDLALKNDAYSHLAIKALLNAGEEGRSKVIEILTQLSSSNLSLVQNAVDHWPLKGQAYNQIAGMVNSSNPAIKQLANQVVNEHNSQEAAMNKKLELNEYSDLGLIN